MKSLSTYIAEAYDRDQRPVEGDVFAFELDDGTLLETYVMDQSQDGNVLLLDATPEIFAILEQWDLVGDDDDNIMESVDQTDEAKYQGREVKLGKPMAGDVKKFKVYVKNPATGNVKKVNFGHGGTTAKRAGQKTMRIRKSNPAARRSFRARHNCENPGPRTGARYWSCRKW